MKLSTFSTLVVTALSVVGAVLGITSSKDPYPNRENSNNDEENLNYRTNKVLSKLLRTSLSRQQQQNEVQPSLMESGTSESETSKNEQNGYLGVSENTETINFSSDDDDNENEYVQESSSPSSLGYGENISTVQFWPVKVLSLLKQLSILYGFYYDFGRATMIHLISFSGIVTFFTFIASLFGI